MKKIFLALACATLVLLAPACNNVNGSDDSNNNITLEVAPEKVVFTAEGGVEAVTISTNGDSWDFTNATSWLEVYANGSELTLVALDYYGKVNRNGEVVVIATKGADFVKKSIVVEQVAPGGSSSDGDANFECEVFKQIVLDYYDQNNDGSLSAEEAAVVTDLTLTYEENGEYGKITSLTGIKNFKNLVNLDCDYNAISKFNEVHI